MGDRASSLRGSWSEALLPRGSPGTPPRSHSCNPLPGLRDPLLPLEVRGPWGTQELGGAGRPEPRAGRGRPGPALAGCPTEEWLGRVRVSPEESRGEVK